MRRIGLVWEPGGLIRYSGDVRSGLAATLFILTGCGYDFADTRTNIPAPRLDALLARTTGRETATFAGGCFWRTQSVFGRVKGVEATTAGHSGGSAKTATYDQITTETTGHAESVKVAYDPSKVTYGTKICISFAVPHNPTQVNRQGPDVGTS